VSRSLLIFPFATLGACLSPFTSMAQEITVQYGRAAQAVVTPLTNEGSGSASYTPYRRANSYISQDWWWYRVNGVSDREYALPGGGTITQNRDNMATYDLHGVADGRFDASRMMMIRSYGHVSSQTELFQSLYLTNTTNQDLSPTIFHYVDIDANGADLNTAHWDASRVPQMRVTDPASDRFSNYQTWSAGTLDTFYQVGASPVVLTLLTDADTDDFGNAGLPFPEGDWTGGYEGDFLLPPHQQGFIGAALSTNKVIPTPGNVVLLAIGGCVVGGRRRRRPIESKEST